MTSSTRTPLPIVSLGPEALFRVRDLAVDESGATGSMQTGPWMEGPDGRVCAGSLGVVIDDALAFALIAERPPGRWSVSAEITIELCASMPTDGSLLRVEGALTHADGRDGLASGLVLDERGSVVARCSQRGRFIRHDASTLPESPWDTVGDPLLSSPLGTVALLGAEVQLTDAGAEVALAASPRLVNPLGSLHGGISLCASEIAGLAALRRSAPELSTSSIHVVYARPIPADAEVTFHASVVHGGRSLAVAQVVGTWPTDAGRPCTIATVTARATD